jgi:hypothetical protein
MPRDRIPATTSEVATWNQAHPVGTPVRYWPGAKTGEGLKSKTRTAAWLLSSGAAVVSVDDYAGGIWLAHIEVIE